MNLEAKLCEEAYTEVSPKVLHQSLDYFREVTYILSEQTLRLERLRNILFGSIPETHKEEVEQDEPQNWSDALTLQIQRTEKVARKFRSLVDSFEPYI